MKNLIKLFAIALLLVSNIKAQPSQEWVQVYDQPDSRNMLYASVTDMEGNSYLTGSSQELLDNNLTSENFLTLKYDKNGNLLWAKTFDSGNAGNDESFAITLDKNGNVYVAGYETSSGMELEEFYIIKYTLDGDEVWHTNFNGPEIGGIKGNDHADRIFVDDHENVFVVGTVQAFDDSSYYLHTNIGVVKFSSDGVLEYSDIYDTPNHGDEIPVGISINKFGQIFVGGYTTPQNGDRGDMFLLMYDSSLNLRWKVLYNSAEEDDRTFLLTTDKYGNAYICGYKKYSNNADTDIFIAKYDTTGTAVWTDAINSTVEGINPNYHYPVGMAIDENDNLYIHAYNSGFENFITKYDLNGNRKWINFWYGAVNIVQDHIDFYRDYNHNIVFDSDNNIYIMGYKTSPDSLYDEALGTAKFDPDGNKIFEVFMYEDYMTDNDNWSNKPIGIGIDKENCIYLTGTYYPGFELGHAFEIVKFSQTVGVENGDGNQPVHFNLEQNYPNPFNPATTISYAIDKREHVRLDVFNLLGQLVTKLVDEEKSAGNYQVVFNAVNLPGGVYYYRLFTDNKMIAKKCLLLK